MTQPPAHVLIIDDERISARTSAEHVRALGYEVTTCHRWTDALEVLARVEIDLVLMDGVMPTVDGFRLTSILRARATEYIPIVFLTGLSDHTTRQRCVEIGADDLLTKPADPLELKLRLHSMLRIRTLTRQLERKQRALERLASVDGLTGIGNRRAFDARVAEELNACQRSGAHMSLLLLDIDHFKRLNDDHGHQLGDRVLMGLGDLLTKVIRKHDIPFRYGGEEFAVIASTTRSDGAVLVAERIRDAFARYGTTCLAGGQTLSVGVSGSDQLDRFDAATLVASADAALYRAKADGRDRVRRYDPGRDHHRLQVA